MTTLYGIPNCDTVKKARVWLAANQIDYLFYDFKKQGISTALLRSWLVKHDWTNLLNKQGTTWRKLAPAIQAGVIDADSAIALMISHPSVIKRPVLVQGESILIGFKPDAYEALK